MNMNQLYSEYFYQGLLCEPYIQNGNQAMFYDSKDPMLIKLNNAGQKDLIDCMVGNRLEGDDSFKSKIINEAMKIFAHLSTTADDIEIVFRMVACILAGKVNLYPDSDNVQKTVFVGAQDSFAEYNKGLGVFRAAYQTMNIAFLVKLIPVARIIKSEYDRVTIEGIIKTFPNADAINKLLTCDKSQQVIGGLSIETLPALYKSANLAKDNVTVREILLYIHTPREFMYICKYGARPTIFLPRELGFNYVHKTRTLFYSRGWGLCNREDALYGHIVFWSDQIGLEYTRRANNIPIVINGIGMPIIIMTMDMEKDANDKKISIENYAVMIESAVNSGVATLTNGFVTFLNNFVPTSEDEITNDQPAMDRKVLNGKRLKQTGWGRKEILEYVEGRKGPATQEPMPGDVITISKQDGSKEVLSYIHYKLFADMCNSLDIDTDYECVEFTRAFLHYLNGMGKTLKNVVTETGSLFKVNGVVKGKRQLKDDKNQIHAETVEEIPYHTLRGVKMVKRKVFDDYINACLEHFNQNETKVTKAALKRNDIINKFRSSVLPLLGRYQDTFYSRRPKNVAQTLAKPAYTGLFQGSDMMQRCTSVMIRQVGIGAHFMKVKNGWKTTDANFKKQTLGRLLDRITNEKMKKIADYIINSSSEETDLIADLFDAFLIIPPATDNVYHTPIYMQYLGPTSFHTFLSFILFYSKGVKTAIFKSGCHYIYAHFLMIFGTVFEDNAVNKEACPINYFRSDIDLNAGFSGSIEVDDNVLRTMKYLPPLRTAGDTMIFSSKQTIPIASVAVKRKLLGDYSKLGLIAEDKEEKPKLVDNKRRKFTNSMDDVLEELKEECKEIVNSGGKTICDYSEIEIQPEGKFWNNKEGIVVTSSNME